MICGVKPLAMYQKLLLGKQLTPVSRLGPLLTCGLHAMLQTGLLLAWNLCFSVPALSRMQTLPSYSPSASNMPSLVQDMHTTLLGT